ncbi:MAG: bifunctional 4-hydroxy-2-oxoglutarate aldolase/2-dehydro-3-deoxy-phosphogluconate aldolase [Bacteroidales bacterium]|nr:bifunctional 4-hydroxy-2-oxoglutarate aldolase/2-dehydro-3-deoxy-phosphogluconate aldolase [Bacteroidales bacterium]
MAKIPDQLKEMPILGILRGIKEEQLSELTGAIIGSGLKVVEITMNTPHAPSLIKKMADIASGRLLIGAGTVLNRTDLFNALEAGAGFIVTPSIVKDVIEYCHLNSIPVFPGALTPTEIHAAWQMGAAMVKVFPASVFGPKYFKEILAPFNDIRLMAVGGVSENNIADYFGMGASAVAFGASIFKKEYLDARRYDVIENEINRLITAWKTKHNKPLNLIHT